jgi:hypothetical protein
MVAELLVAFSRRTVPPPRSDCVRITGRNAGGSWLRTVCFCAATSVGLKPTKTMLTGTFSVATSGGLG